MVLQTLNWECSVYSPDLQLDPYPVLHLKACLHLELHVMVHIMHLDVAKNFLQVHCNVHVTYNYQPLHTPYR